MKNETEMANFALMAVGSGQIQSIGDEGNSAVLCNTWIDLAIRTTLKSIGYQGIVRRVSLSFIGSPVDGWAYRYTLPKGCLKILQVLGADKVTPLSPNDWYLESNFLNCNVSGAYLKCVVAPTDISDIEDFASKACGYALALLIAPGLGIDQGDPIITRVEQKYRQAHGQALTHNSQMAAPPQRRKTWGSARTY